MMETLGSSGRRPSSQTKADIDGEIHQLLLRACTKFGRLRRRVFDERISKAPQISDQVKSSIQSLTKDQSEIQQMELQQKEKISGVLEQSHNLQSKITSKFAELHQIITEKGQRVLADIREEEKKILNRMKKKLGKIKNKNKSTQVELLKLQQQMDQKDSVVFLKEEVGRKRR
ncbi:uncharacterized protein LOC144602819 [Rhinoraja longicauda]